MSRQLILLDATSSEAGRGLAVRIFDDPREDDPGHQSIAVYPNDLTEQPIVSISVTGAETVVESLEDDPPGPPPHQ